MCQTRLEPLAFSFFTPTPSTTNDHNHGAISITVHNGIASHDGHDNHPSIWVFICFLILFKSLAFKNNNVVVVVYDDDDSPFSWGIAVLFIFR